MASFLLDRPSSVARDLVVADPGTQHWAVFTFIHDRWQVTPKLTLDLGLRHEYYTPFVGLQDQGGLSNFDPETNTLRIAGYGNVPANLGVKTAKDNFAPRTGVSYRINEKTVLRGGYGVSIIPFPDNQYAFNFPVKQNNQFNPPVSFAPAGSMQAGFPPPITAAIPRTGSSSRTRPSCARSSTTWCPPTCRRARSTPGTWPSSASSRGGSRARSPTWATAAAACSDGSSSTPGSSPASTTRDGPPSRPSTARHPRRVVEDEHALRLDAGQARPALTRTASLDQLLHPEPGQGLRQRQRDHRHPRGRLAQLRSRRLRPHAFVRVELRLRAAIPEERLRAMGAILGGWQVAGVFVAQSGTPVDIRAAGQPARAAEPAAAEPQRGPERARQHRARPAVLDTSVYSAACPNTFGNMARNAAPAGPATSTSNMSLVKRVKVNGRVALELRRTPSTPPNTRTSPTPA
jgi:hypothetical protein